MILKSLALTGFKSFPEKTSLSFQPGITAVVGPNGCGKSNVVDAIRWVLGEQRPRLLRGKAMEDVIFKGSADRKSVGMAEVSLTLSGEEGRGSLPGGLSEVMICRRLYRSGESEYLLNRRPCRLKDIADLFMDAGISSRLYSVVEQGQIGQILSGRSEERRMLIEEAAGIAKYRERKREALLKLEASQQNLWRAEDVLREVTRQVNSLKRQAAQAERYRQLKEEARHLENALARSRAASIEEKIRETDQELGGARARLAELSELVARAEEAVRVKQTEMTLVEERRAELERDCAALKLESLRNDESIRSTAREREIIEQRRLEIEGELEALGARLGAASEQMEALLAEQGRIASALTDLGVEIRDKEAALSSLRATLEGRESELNEFASSLFELHRARAQAASRLAQIDEAVARATEAEGRLAAERERIETRLTALQQEGQALSKKADDLGHQLADRRQAEERLARETVGLESVKACLAEEVARFKEAVSQATARLTILMELERSLEGYGPEVKKLLTSDNGGEILGVVGETIQVDPRFERAVEAVLSERLQFLIVEDPRSGLVSVNNGGKASGRLGLIPKNPRHNGQGNGASTASMVEKDRTDGLPEGGLDPGIIGELSSLVTTEPRFAGVRDCLFSGWVVVSDLQTALSLWEAGHLLNDAVTLDGTLLHRTGVLVTCWERAPEASPIGRKRQVKEIGEELRDLEAELALRTGRMEELRTKGEELERQVGLLRGEIADLDRELFRCQAASLAALEERARLLEHGNLVSSERKQLSDQLGDLTCERREMASGRAELEERCSEAERELKSLRGSVDDLDARVASQGEELSRLKVEEASLQGKCQGIEGQRASLTDSLEALRRERSSKEERLQELRATLQRLTEVEVEEKAKRDRLALDLQSSEKELAEVALRCWSASSECSLAQEEVHRLRDTNSELRESVRDLEHRINEAHLELDHVAARIRDKYGMELAALSPQEVGHIPEAPEGAEARLTEIVAQMDRMGEVNLLALDEYDSLKKRQEELSNQRSDLADSIGDLRRTIKEVDRTCRERFQETFSQVDERFNHVFRKLFQGGRAQLIVTEGDDPLEAGIDLIVEPPGKRLTNASLLSGGEKALAAIALVVAIFMVRPTPFCFLDEVDAPLDDANIGRFVALVKELSADSQFVLITHNKRTMEAADLLYGITMEEAGISKLVSVRLN